MKTYKFIAYIGESESEKENVLLECTIKSDNPWALNSFRDDVVKMMVETGVIGYSGGYVNVSKVSSVE